MKNDGYSTKVDAHDDFSKRDKPAGRHFGGIFAGLVLFFDFLSAGLYRE